MSEAERRARLAGREDVGAIHIVSHGSDGSVQLGKSSLDFDTLLKNGIGHVRARSHRAQDT